MFDSANINPNGQATTALLANGEGYTFIAGAGHDTTDTTVAIGPLAASNYTEHEYSFAVNKNAVTDATYCFRLYDAATANTLDTYARFPELTLSGQSSESP